MRAAGFVLVGGRSSRMGQNKARLRVNTRLLVEVVADALAQVTNSVALVGDPASFTDLPFDCLPDLRPGLGPVAGLEAALASNRGELNVVVGCDMPGIQAADLSRLLAVSRQSNELCTLVRDAVGCRHPLCAVYRRGCLPYAQAALDAKRLRLLDFVEELKAVEVAIDSVLNNVNTPEQWGAWQAAHLA